MSRGAILLLGIGIGAVIAAPLAAPLAVWLLERSLRTQP